MNLPSDLVQTQGEISMNSSRGFEKSLFYRRSTAANNTFYRRLLSWRAGHVFGFRLTVSFLGTAIYLKIGSHVEKKLIKGLNESSSAKGMGAWEAHAQWEDEP